MRNEIRGGLAWLGTSTALCTYATLGLLGIGIPGVEEIVGYIQSVSGPLIFVAAFIAILIEGLYVVGNFFPGSTFVLIVAVLSHMVNFSVFVGTILAIFCGWCISGGINIFVASRYRNVVHSGEHLNAAVRDNIITTWFPAFRASYEVAQVAEGGRPLRVFISSVRVKAIVSAVMGGIALIIPLFIDIASYSNEEGFTSVLGVAAITTAVGGWKIYKAKLE